MSKLYLAFLVCLGICFLMPSTAVGQPLLHTLCSEKMIAQTGSYSDFNKVQCKIALAPLRTLEQQSGETCVCEALLNVAFELADPKTTGELQKTYCVNKNFGDVFSKYAGSTTPPKGRVFGGFSGALRTKSLVKPEEAIRQVVEAISNKQIVAISLNVSPIYDDYAKKNNISYEGIGISGAHALVIRALYKNNSGEITHFFVVDSSGPERLYAIPSHLLLKAYSGGVLATAYRGVYISTAQRKTISLH